MASAMLDQPDPITAESDHSTTTIVVGVDGTEPSLSAFCWACGEARRVNARVIAAYVTCLIDTGLAIASLNGLDAGQYILASTEIKNELAEQLETEVRGIAAELEVRLDFLHLHGDTAEQLLHVAHNTRADILAVGRSAHIRHRIAGSLGRKLTRGRDTPIIVIVP